MCISTNLVIIVPEVVVAQPGSQLHLLTREAKIEGLKNSVLIRILSRHAGPKRLTKQAPAPYSDIPLRIDQCTRRPDGRTRYRAPYPPESVRQAGNLAIRPAVPGHRLHHTCPTTRRPHHAGAASFQHPTAATRAGLPRCGGNWPARSCSGRATKPAGQVIGILPLAAESVEGELGDAGIRARLCRELTEAIVGIRGRQPFGPVDVRILSPPPPHKDLGELVEDGRFRHDLYYRINLNATSTTAR